MERTTVLLTGPQLAEQAGGIQTHVRHLIDAFATSDAVEIRHFPVTLALYDRESWLAKFMRFFRLILPFAGKARSADTVHLNSTFDNRSLIRDGIYLAVAAVVLGKPVIVQFHGGLPAEVGLLKGTPLRRLYAILLGQAKEILILSKLQGMQFAQCFPGLRYRVVPNYIDCNLPEGLSRQVSAKPLRFLFMGRLHESKGIREIVAAAHALAAAGYHFEIELCGDGPSRNWLEDEIRRQPASNPYLVYSGSVFGKEKTAALQRSDVMLLPSSHAEGFPYALLEAAKYGLPMIATAVGGIPDVIRHRENGLLIKERDAELLTGEMEFAIRHPGLIKEMGKQARRQAESEFSFDCLRHTFGSLYSAAAGAR